MEYKPKNQEELKRLIDDESVYLGDIDTSLIIDMHALFNKSVRKDFSGIGTWNVENVRDMCGMFYYAESFNQDISSWNVSKVSDMSLMFCEAKSFNQNLDSWDISSLKDVESMFDESMQNPLPKWFKSSK